LIAQSYRWLVVSIWKTGAGGTGVGTDGGGEVRIVTRRKTATASVMRGGIGGDARDGKQQAWLKQHA